MMFTEKNVSIFLIIAKCLLMIYCQKLCVGETSRKYGMSKEEKQNCLHLHNQMRVKVATGQEGRGSLGPQPAAANMMEMIWDNELAVMAQRWANRCAKSKQNYQTELSDRNISRFAIGQNTYLFRFNLSGRYDDKPNWRSPVSAWYDDVQRYDFRNSGIPIASHYTQLVWANSSRLGCAYSFYTDRAHGYKNYVCNYAPGGNIPGEPPYQSGQLACDKYGLSYSNRYRGLCSNGSS